jgi:tRNA(Ile)-lysidine synthase
LASSPPARLSPQWLAAQLARLFEDYPQLSLCVAVSGGVDSTALLALLAQIPARRFGLRAVHVNHGLHPNASSWSKQCVSLAHSLGVPIDVLTTKVKRARGESLEAAARAARYALLARHMVSDEVLLTGHHQDDQLETVLLQLFRGSGLAGLAAMPERSRFAAGWLARPLLSQTRATLTEWTRRQGLTWVEDDTNADERLDRNYLRKRVLPLIRERWPGVAGAVGRSARHAAEGQRLLEGLARADAERAADGEALCASSLRALPPDRRRNALRFWIVRSGRRVPDTRRLDEMCGALLDARPDANPHVAWGDGILRREGGRLTLSNAPMAPATSSAAGPPTRARDPAASASAAFAMRRSVQWDWRAGPLPLPAGGALELSRDPRGPVDLRTLPALLTVGCRRGGERLRPRRGGPRRALKSLLQEARVPVTERAGVPLIFAGEQLVAAADLWLDESIQHGKDGAPTGSHAGGSGRFRWRRPKH